MNMTTAPAIDARPAAPRSPYRRIADGYREFRRYSRRSELMWRYTVNLKNVMSYRLNGPHRSQATNRVVADMDQHGIAITHVSSLFDDERPYRDLVAAVARLEEDKAAEIVEARAHGSVSGKKSYNLELLGDGVPEPGSAFERFARHPAIVAVADDYFRMKTTLRACNVWRTFVAHEPARQSQLWHRDPEDRYILKLFVLLSDVDDLAGPFTYAPGTHMRGSRNHPFIERHGLQDSEMSAIVKPDEWVKATGTKGTVVFADTRGYHKGGHVKAHERLMFVGMFLSY
jgi:hypothetical protein